MDYYFCAPASPGVARWTPYLPLHTERVTKAINHGNRDREGKTAAHNTGKGRLEQGVLYVDFGARNRYLRQE